RLASSRTCGTGLSADPVLLIPGLTAEAPRHVPLCVVRIAANPRDAHQKPGYTTVSVQPHDQSAPTLPAPVLRPLHYAGRIASALAGALAPERREVELPLGVVEQALDIVRVGDPDDRRPGERVGEVRRR